MKLPTNIGMVVLSVYLIIAGVIAVFEGINIPPVVPGVLAIASGVLLLIGK